MKIEAVDLTTGPVISQPEKAFRMLSVMNQTVESEYAGKVEVYPVKLPRLGTNRLVDQAVGVIPFNITAEKVKRWREVYGVEVCRVHQPWMYSWYEIAHQAAFGDWYPNHIARVASTLQISVLGPASNGDGVYLIEELMKGRFNQPIGTNIHPNAFEGLLKDGSIKVMRSKGVSPILVENAIEFNSPILPDRQVLDDPRLAVERFVKPDGADGLLLAVDHLFGIWPKDEVNKSKNLDRLNTMLDDRRVREHTMAVHLTLPARGAPDLEDPFTQTVIKWLKNAKTTHPVRVALDFRSKEFNQKSEVDQVRYLTLVRDVLLT